MADEERELMMHYNTEHTRHTRKGKGERETKIKYLDAQSRDVTRWRPPNSSDRTRACFKIVCCKSQHTQPDRMKRKKLKKRLRNGSRGFYRFVFPFQLFSLLSGVYEELRADANPWVYKQIALDTQQQQFGSTLYSME